MADVPAALEVVALLSPHYNSIKVKGIVWVHLEGAAAVMILSLGSRHVALWVFLRKMFIRLGITANECEVMIYSAIGEVYCKGDKVIRLHDT